MEKVLPRDEKIKKAFHNLYNLNQRLKCISTSYYIGYDGIVYLKSSVRFTDCLVQLRYPEKIDIFQGCMVLPNQLFEFGKRLKKSKLAIEEIHDTKENEYKFHFYQSDYKELEYTLYIINPIKEMNQSYLDTKIIPKFYKRMFEVSDETKYEQFNFAYYPLDNDQIESLYSSQAVETTLPSNDNILLTKHFFLDIKKGDYIQIARIARQKIEGEENQYRNMFMIQHDTDQYISFTLFNKIYVEKV